MFVVGVCGWCLWLMFVVGIGIGIGVGGWYCGVSIGSGVDVGVGVPGLLDFMQVGHIDILQWVDSQWYIIKGCARSAEICADLAHWCPIAVWGCVFGR